MKGHRLLLCTLLSLAPLAGCSLIVGGKIVKGPADMSKLPRIDPNDPNAVVSSRIIETSAGKRLMVKAKSLVIDMEEDPYRLKHGWPPLRGFRFHGVPAGSNHKYDVVVDTGSPYSILVNDLHVRKHNLPIYSVPGTSEGVCQLPDLQIGRLTVRRPAAVYRWEHFVMLLVGIPMNEDDIVIGVPFLQRFKYVALDDAEREVEFSLAGSFDPEDPNAWSRYPFADPNKADEGRRICIEIPVEDQTLNLAFDTGYSNALLIREDTWQQLKGRLSGAKSGGKPLYGPMLGGKMPSSNAVVEQLHLGDETIRKAHVNILPNEAPLLKSFKKAQGLIGMECFEKTIVVLDFERNAMWVKNRAGTRGP